MGEIHIHKTTQYHSYMLKSNPGFHVKRMDLNNNTLLIPVRVVKKKAVHVNKEYWKQ